MGYTYKEGDFNDNNPENEFLNLIEGVKYINHDKEKSDGDSVDNQSNKINYNSNEKIRKKMKSSEIKKNVINANFDKEINTENNEDNN